MNLKTEMIGGGEHGFGGVTEGVKSVNLTVINQRRTNIKENIV